MPAEAAAAAPAAATPAAAAAPAATPAAAPATPSGRAPQAFDVRLALAKNLGSPRGDGQPPPAAATTAAGGNIDADPDAAAPADADGAADDGDGADGAADEADGAAAGAEAPTDAQRLEAITKAFESGDVDAMAKALEKDGAKVPGPVRRQFRAFKRRTQQLDDRERKADDRDREFETARGRAQQVIADESRRLSAQGRELAQTYGWAHALQRAWDDEDMLAVGKALERGCKGATLATITQKLATGKTGKTPEEKQLADDRRKLDEEKAAGERKKQDDEDAKQRATKREAALGRVGTALKDHPYLQTTDDKGAKVVDQEALNEVFTAYEASWNGEKFTKTARQCADELQQKLVARAKARGLAAPAPAPAAAPAGKNGKPRAPAARTGVREPPRTQASAHPRGTPADMEASRANRLAQARRLTEMQRRGVR